jgi:hypothetical protein
MCSCRKRVTITRDANSAKRPVPDHFFNHDVCQVLRLFQIKPITFLPLKFVRRNQGKQIFPMLPATPNQLCLEPMLEFPGPGNFDRKISHRYEPIIWVKSCAHVQSRLLFLGESPTPDNVVCASRLTYCSHRMSGIAVIVDRAELLVPHLDPADAKFSATKKKGERTCGC